MDSAHRQDRGGLLRVKIDVKLLQHIITAGEVAVARRQVADLRSGSRKVRRVRVVTRPRGRRRARALLVGGGQQLATGPLFGYADQVDVDGSLGQAVRFAGLDAYRQEEAPLAGGVVGQHGLPFQGAVFGGEVGRRQYGDGAASRSQRVVHLVREAAARPEVEGLHD